jgi:hypothetical protein
MASEATMQECRGTIEFLELDWVAVKGRETPVVVFTPLALKGKLALNQELARKAFTAGLALYRQGSFLQAGQAFQECLTHWPDFSPGREFQHRCLAMQAHPTALPWDAVFRPDKK